MTDQVYLQKINGNPGFVDGATIPPFASKAALDASGSGWEIGTIANAAGVPYSWGGAGVGWRSAKRTRFVSSLGGFRTNIDAMSNGTTQTGGTDRVPFVSFGDASEVSMIFVNGRVSSAGFIQKTGNDLTVKASIEVPPQCKPSAFVGDTASGIIVRDGGFVETKPMMLAIKAGEEYYSRTYKTVPVGGKWPYTNAFPIGSRTTDITNGETVGSGLDITENFGGDMPVAITNKGAFFPTAIVGNLSSSCTIHQIQGDSIANGAGASSGYLQLAIDSIEGHESHTDAFSGSALLNNNMYDEVAAYLSRYADSVILHVGTNDLAIPLISDLQTYIREVEKFILRNAAAGFFHICTILPRTTSLDSWSTVSGQSVEAFEPLRVQINNWLRSSLRKHMLSLGYNASCIDNCVGYERNADGSLLGLIGGVQPDNTGGRHPANCTIDGIHPNDTAVAILAPIAAAQILRA